MPAQRQQAGEGVAVREVERAAPAGGRSLAASAFGQLERFGVGIIFVVLLIVFSIALPDTFPTYGNIVTMISSQAILVVLTLAVLMPLRAGDFDLSVASTMVVAAASTTQLAASGPHLPLLVAGLIGIAIGAFIGIVNAILVVFIGLDAFVATLGVMTVLQGIGYAITNNQVLINVPHGYTSFVTDKLFDIPLGAYYGWALALICLFVYRYRPFGRQLLFVGGARDAAALVGIRVKRVRATAFVFSGAMAGFAGILLIGTYGSVDPSVAGQYLLAPYAAAFLGAATIDVGRFNVLGAILALYLIVVGTTGLELLGAPNWISYVFDGGTLIIALATGRLLRLRAAKTPERQPAPVPAEARTEAQAA
jgi:ribose transport system permease protein